MASASAARMTAGLAHLRPEDAERLLSLAEPPAQAKGRPRFMIDEIAGSSDEPLAAGG
jgi:hypothetical protein